MFQNMRNKCRCICVSQCCVTIAEEDIDVQTPQGSKAEIYETGSVVSKYNDSTQSSNSYFNFRYQKSRVSFASEDASQALQRKEKETRASLPPPPPPRLITAVKESVEIHQ